MACETSSRNCFEDYSNAGYWRNRNLSEFNNINRVNKEQVAMVCQQLFDWELSTDGLAHVGFVPVVHARQGFLPSVCLEELWLPV